VTPTFALKEKNSTYSLKGQQVKKIIPKPIITILQKPIILKNWDKRSLEGKPSQKPYNLLAC